MGDEGWDLLKAQHLTPELSQRRRFVVGIWVITFGTAHPLGANYVVSLTPRNAAAYVCFNPAPTTTRFTVTLTAPGTASPAVDAIFSFMVLA